MKQDDKGGTHGQIDYVQLPARDIAHSAAFYEKFSTGQSMPPVEALKHRE